MNHIEPVQIWTKGACQGQARVGGWAYAKSFNGETQRRSGNVIGETTSVVMSMVATIQALRSLKRRDVPAVVHTNDEMVVKGMTQWLPGWMANGWRNNQGKRVENRELWEALKAAVDAHTAGVTFIWERITPDNAGLRSVDWMAKASAQEAVKKIGNGPAMPTRFDQETGLVVGVFELEEA